MLRAEATLSAAGIRAERGKDGKLTDQSMKTIRAVAEQQVLFSELSREYKPSFSGMGGGVPMLADGQLAAAQNFPGLSSRNSREAAKFWQKYARFDELVQRHGFFGATLTGKEEGSWRAADVSPNKSDASNVANFNTRQRLAKTKVASLVAMYQQNGIPPATINAMFGFDVTNLNAAFPEFSMPQPSYAAPAPAPAGVGAPPAAPVQAPAPAQQAPAPTGTPPRPARMRWNPKTGIAEPM
jgi:hypothetical protein